MSFLSQLLFALHEASTAPGRLPDRGQMPVPFPVYQRHVIGSEYNPTFAQAPIQLVALSDLYATQNTVDARQVDTFLDAPAVGGLPIVARVAGRLLIMAGHHRLTAAHLRGEVMVAVRLHEDAELLDIPTASVTALAKKHGVSESEIEAQLKIGIDIESEHTTNKDLAREIALDHLGEFPDYYDRLKQVEEDAPAMSAGAGGVAGIGIGAHGEPGFRLARKQVWEETDTFAGCDVLDTNPDKFAAVRNPKKRWERFSKYVGMDEEGEAIRQHARKRWQKDIILRDSRIGTMTWLRKRNTSG